MPIDHYLKADRPWKILVIDDSKLIRAIVKNTLSKLNMEVTEANDGQEGLDILSKNEFDLVLVDLIMPNLDGFGFLEKYKDLVKEHFIPVILMTGSDDLNLKIKGLNIAADDFLQKPPNEKELTARVNSLLRLKSVNSELFEKNELIKKELETARRVQQFIIPEDFSSIDYPKISSIYLPIEDIGGDFYDYYTLPNNNIGILIADVTGHGIPAALVMSMSKMNFSIFSSLFDSADRLMHRVNNEMRGLLLDYQYITAFYTIYDPEKNIISFSNAGHTRPLYYRSEKDKILALDTEGLFIGIQDNTEYGEKKIKVQKGDRLFLYTDGISEIKNSDHEEFGEARLASFIKNNKDLKGDGFCEALLNEVRKFTSLDDRYDDLAFLNIEF